MQHLARMLGYTLFAHHPLRPLNVPFARIALRCLLSCLFLSLVTSACSDDQAASVGPETDEQGRANTSVPLATPVAIPAPAGVNAAGELLTLEVVDTGAVTGLITDFRGYAVYGVDGELPGQFVCTDTCTDTWIPLIPRDDAVSDRLESASYSTTVRPDGSVQAVYATIPLYLWTGDGEIGIPSGAGVAGIWFALTAEGLPVS